MMFFCQPVTTFMHYLLSQLQLPPECDRVSLSAALEDVCGLVLHVKNQALLIVFHMHSVRALASWAMLHGVHQHARKLEGMRSMADEKLM
jgi:hypothetical protein